MRSKWADPFRRHRSRRRRFFHALDVVDLDGGDRLALARARRSPPVSGMKFKGSDLGLLASVRHITYNTISTERLPRYHYTLSRTVRALAARALKRLTCGPRLSPQEGSDRP